MGRDGEKSIGMKNDMNKATTKNIKMDIKKQKDIEKVETDTITKKDTKKSAGRSDFFKEEACTYPCEFEGKDGEMKQGVLIDFSYPSKQEKEEEDEQGVKQFC